MIAFFCSVTQNCVYSLNVVIQFAAGMFDNHNCFKTDVLTLLRVKSVVSIRVLTVFLGVFV